MLMFPPTTPASCFVYSCSVYPNVRGKITTKISSSSLLKKSFGEKIFVSEVFALQKSFPFERKVSLHRGKFSLEVLKEGLVEAYREMK
jgi:hypothetical protein